MGSCAGAQNASSQSGLVQPLPLPSGLLGPGPSVGGDQMPVPEGGVLRSGTYSNPYFGFSYRLPPDWGENSEGPPPSDTGYYVLAQFKRVDGAQGAIKGTILITASDVFFSSPPDSSPKQLIENMKATLSPVYQVETLPLEVRLGNHSFTRFDYQAPAAQLHWRILATKIRCHMVKFVFTSQDTRLLDALVQSLDRANLSALSTSAMEGNDVPLCIPDYASDPHLVHRVDPSFAGPRFTNIPVRIIIDKNGKVRSIHVISAFPAQAENIKTALRQWRFKPYVQNSRPVEVETGILFEFPPRDRKSQGRAPNGESRFQ